MPADLNRTTPIFRTNFLERNLKYKRAKGEASCAECRRLKLKCDKKIPCTSCVRRGCQVICPNGSLKSGQGSRFVLTNTDKLHGKLLQMSNRIRQLEDALQIAHASASPTAHALLSEELLAIKSAVDVMGEKEDLDNVTELVGGLSDELGTLSICECGEACFIGRGSSEALLMVINESLPDQTAQDVPTIGSLRAPKALPCQISTISESFPFSFGYLPTTSLLETIEARLPSYARATALAEAYLTNIAWSFIVVSREQIFEELLPAIYERFNGSPPIYHDDDFDNAGDHVYRLALLLSVLACGAQGDLTLPVNNDESELYNKLSRASLSLKSVFVGAPMETVQTLVMLSAYDLKSCKEQSLEPAWKMLSFALTLGVSFGLHRDPAHWKMEPKMVQRRRHLFWEIFYLDKWKSLETGRPATIDLREVDCEFPEDKEATINEHGSTVDSFWNWKCRFTKDVLAPVAEQLCLARPLRYFEILELDRKLSEFEPRPSLSLSGAPESDEDIAGSLRRFYWAVIREMTSLHIHRSVFARAMLENPARPFGSPHVSSLLAAYTSAVKLLRLLKTYYEKYPLMLLGQWTVWAHGLTSAVIVGSVACRGPVAPTASTALNELEAAVELYKAAQVQPVSRKALPFLLHLLERARDANQPVPKGPGISRQELIVLGGAPILLNKARRRGSTSPESSKQRRQSDGEALVDSLPISGTHRPTMQQAPSCLPQQFQPFPTSSNELPSNNLGNVWPQSSTFKIPTSTDVQTHGPSTNSEQYWNSHDLSSEPWLEELLHNIPANLQQSDLNDINATDLDVLLGSSTGSEFARLQRGDDSIIAEAWHSLMTGSQTFRDLISDVI